MRLVDSSRVGQCVKFEVMRDAGLAVVSFEWKVGLPYKYISTKIPDNNKEFQLPGHAVNIFNCKYLEPQCT